MKTQKGPFQFVLNRTRDIHLALCLLAFGKENLYSVEMKIGDLSTPVSALWQVSAVSF